MRAIIMPRKGLVMKPELANTRHTAYTDIGEITKLEGFIFPDD